MVGSPLETYFALFRGHVWPLGAGGIPKEIARVDHVPIRSAASYFGSYLDWVLAYRQAEVDYLPVLDLVFGNFDNVGRQSRSNDCNKLLCDCYDGSFDIVDGELVGLHELSSLVAHILFHGGLHTYVLQERTTLAEGELPQWVCENTSVTGVG